jgi:hypothetical protein
LNLAHVPFDIRVGSASRDEEPCCTALFTPQRRVHVGMQVTITTCVLSCCWLKMMEGQVVTGTSATVYY